LDALNAVTGSARGFSNFQHRVGAEPKTGKSFLPIHEVQRFADESLSRLTLRLRRREDVPALKDGLETIANRYAEPSGAPAFPGGSFGRICL
jgi:hypothetical protein